VLYYNKKRLQQWYEQYIAFNFWTKYGLERTRCGSNNWCGCQFFCRRWLPGGRCISRRSLFCCRFNAGCRVWQCCRNGCDNRTVSQVIRRINIFIKLSKSFVKKGFIINRLVMIFDDRRYMYTFLNMCNVDYSSVTSNIFVVVLMNRCRLL